jgi:hypothetical protein
VKASDFLTRRELHRTQLYGLALKPYSLDYMLGMRLRIPPPSRPSSSASTAAAAISAPATVPSSTS